MYSFFCNQSRSVKKSLNPYVITMLGTSTNYKPSNEQKSKLMRKGSEQNEIPYTELLGFISEQINSTHKTLLPDEHGNQFKHVRYRLNPITTVINGPDVQGHKVNHRIAMGVYEALRALFNGYDEINLIGHSRGAVESIIIAHEIQRIQQAINNENFTIEEFKNIYLNSPNPKINQCLDKLFPKDFTLIDELVFTPFIAKLKKIRINIFAIDPVPGGEYETILLSKLSWWPDHQRYLQIPSIVKNYTQLLMENDHSVGFRTIYPVHNLDTTNFNVINLLGAHGTASGNPLKHDDTAPIGVENEIRDCQFIAMAHLVDFLEKNSVELNICNDETIFLSQHFNEYLQASHENRAALKLNYYERMIANLPSYSVLETTSYTGICENVVSRRTSQLSPNRYLYELNIDVPSSPKPIKNYFPEYIVSNRSIVNFEHALLSLGLPNLDEIDLNDIDTTQLLQDIIEAHINGEDANQKAKTFKIQKCIYTFEWIIQQVKYQISEADELTCFSYITDNVMNLLSKEIYTLNQLQKFFLHKIFTLYMTLQERQWPVVEGYDKLKALMLKLNTGYAKLDFDSEDVEAAASKEDLEDVRKQYLEDSKSLKPLSKIQSEILSYTDLSIVSMVGAVALVPLLFCPVVNALPILISIGALLAFSLAFLLLDSYQPEVSHPSMA